MERELEVKILDMDLELIEEKVLALGGRLIAKEEQTNTLIDSKDKPIKGYLDAYLRIREVKDLMKDENLVEFTLKKNKKNQDYRENIELTTQIKDKAILIEILKNLGFDHISVGHKFRKSYSFMGARLDFDYWDMDTYPFPYMEIEVKDKAQLDNIIQALEIPEENVSRKSIVELRKELKLI